MLLSLIGLLRLKWKAQLDNYFFPSELFPSHEQRKKLLHQDQTDEAGPNRSPMQKFTDKELSRFIRSSVAWDNVHRAHMITQGYKDLGSGSWIADYDSLPFIPQELESIVTHERDSIADFVHKTYTKKQVLYCAHSGEFELPQNEQNSDEYVSELFFIIIKQGQAVHIKDALTLAGIKARMIFGFIEADATLVFTTRDDYQAGYGLFQEHWTVGARAILKTVAAVKGGIQTWTLKEFALHEEAVLDHRTVTALTGSQQAALITRQFHLGRSSRSSVQVKTALKETAHAFYRGTISINEMAYESSADQQHKALILDRTARSCGIPSLEVETDKVSCRHGSAAGYFNDQERSYLLSRGYDEKQAHTLLLRAFYRDILPHDHESRAIDSLLSHMDAL